MNQKQETRPRQRPGRMLGALGFGPALVLWLAGVWLAGAQPVNPPVRPATQAEVNAGAAVRAYVTPDTLAATTLGIGTNAGLNAVQVTNIVNAVVDQADFVKTNETRNPAIGPNATGFVLYGEDNVVANGGLILGGTRNTNEGLLDAVLVGGFDNHVASVTAALVGGSGNRAVDAGAFLGGGLGNSSEGGASVVGGGTANVTMQQYEFIGGGEGNRVNGGHNSFIVAGRTNIVNADEAAAVGFHLNVTNTGEIKVGYSTRATTISSNGNVNIAGDLNVTGPNKKIVFGSIQSQSGNIIASDVTGDVSATSFTGSGAGLTALAGTAITAGTVNSNAMDAATLALFAGGGSLTTPLAPRDLAPTNGVPDGALLNYRTGTNMWSGRLNWNGTLLALTNATDGNILLIGNGQVAGSSNAVAKITMDYRTGGTTNTGIVKASVFHADVAVNLTDAGELRRNNGKFLLVNSSGVSLNGVSATAPVRINNYNTGTPMVAFHDNGITYFSNSVQALRIILATNTGPSDITNGLSAFWNSNGYTTFLRHSVPGGVTYTDTPIAVHASP